MRATSLFLVPAVLLLGSCEPQSTIVVGAADGACDLAPDKLTGTTWVMLEAMPDRTDRKNPMARMQWFEEDGVQKLKYTVKSLSDVYTYDCKLTGEGDDAEWQCREKPRVQDWCQALEVGKEGSCTREKLREFGAVDATEAELDKAIADAKEMVAKYRNTPSWAAFQLNNNNLANKLQGMVDAKVNSRKCQLRVTDMYMTIFNGQKKVDSNPVGTNPFVKADEGADYLFEHCTDGRSLVDLSTVDLPKDLSTIPPRRLHSLGNEVYYHFLGEAAVKPEAGCSYSKDVYTQWERIAKDVPVNVGADGKLAWGGSYKWDSLRDQAVGVYHVVRYKQCGGAKEKIDVVCNAAILK